MAITTSTISSTDADSSLSGINDAFAITKHDTNYIEHPDFANRQVITKGIAISAAGALKVEFPDGGQRTIPSGLLAPGVIHPLHIVKVFNTGTDAITVWAFI